MQISAAYPANIDRYIRDLLDGLHDTENFDPHMLALSTAAALIRSKADFGTELKDRCEEIAFVLVGLSNPFDMENWYEMRQQAMIAVVVAQPRQMAPWFAAAYFNGDYSISQRGSILTALGLAARELAGFQREETHNAPFASKRLPDRLHKLYAETSEVDALTRQLEQTMLRPLTTKKQRKKIIRNDLAGFVAESFFFPLTGYWQAVTQSRQVISIRSEYSLANSIQVKHGTFSKIHSSFHSSSKQSPLSHRLRALPH